MFDNEQYYYQDFTETNYQKLLNLTKQHYHFTFFDKPLSCPHVFWRHDIDYSVHRALRLAQIEAKHQVRSTYFILLHCVFYNVFEKAIAECIRTILTLGHQLALHFDMAFYKDNAEKTLEQHIIFEKNIIESLFDTQIKAISFHNPTANGVLRHNRIANLINTYGQTIVEHYHYCSDSNGYWRFKRLEDILTAATHDKLHILTHPAWWVPEVLSPRDRISRCIEGRAQFIHNHYDLELVQDGRENIGK